LGLGPFTKKYPARAINVGVQEANMYGVCAGLSLVGYVPYAHTFACFASRRAFDQIFMSCAYAKLNVRVVGSDPGVTAMFNGGTHMAFEDIALMRAVPQMTILEPVDSVMMRDLVRQTADLYGMYYIRLMRKPQVKLYEEGSMFTIGKAVTLREGMDVTIIATGFLAWEALKAAQILAERGIQARVLNMFTIKPVDQDAILAAAQETGAVVTAENHNAMNGLGSAVAETLVEVCPVPMERIGVFEQFGEVGPLDYLKDRFGMTAAHIAEKTVKVISRKKQRQSEPA
jgi:transketolase